jgi:hypothetical protein
MINPLTTYSKAVEASLQAGNATEHTHRPALKALIEALAPGVNAINEPQRIACGAPDLVVLRAGSVGDRPEPGRAGFSPAGYVEAKDVGKSLDDAERSDQLRDPRVADPVAPPQSTATASPI